MSNINTVNTFEFIPGITLRAFEHADKGLWFFAADVCEALGLQKHHGAYTHHIQRLGLNEVASGAYLHAQPGGKGNWKVARWVNESGLYKLVMRSTKPEAAAFKDWVTGTVLPTIRKTGGYMVPEVAKLAQTDQLVFMAKSVLVAQEVLSHLQAENAVLAVRAEGIDPTLDRDLTVLQWCELRGRDLTQGQRTSLGHQCRALVLQAGLQMKKTNKSLWLPNTKGGKVQAGQVGVYALRTLDQAARTLKLL